MSVAIMEERLEKVSLLYQDSRNPISYWADMSKCKDEAENLTGEWVAQKGSRTNS